MNKNADRFIGPDASVNAPETPRSDPAAQLLAEFRQRWNHGDQPRVEMFFKSHPTLAEHPEIILDLIYQEVVLREEHGESVELSEYVQRFGKYERELADLFEIHRAVETSHARASTWNVFSQTSVGQHSRGPKEMSLPVIPGFSIESVLGRGGMGVVYKARQLELNRIVALKMVEVDDPERATERDRIRSEAQLVARMHHPNIVQIFEIGNHQGQPFLVLEFVDGGSLAQKLQGTPFDVNEAARLMITVCRAVQYAHDRRLIHRDVKPANVLLTESGEPKVADFGLAKLLDSDVSQSVSGAMVGTPSYMAPEQIDRRGRTVGPTADVYGLGAMLY